MRNIETVRNRGLFCLKVKEELLHYPWQTFMSASTLAQMLKFHVKVFVNLIDNDRIASNCVGFRYHPSIILI